MVDYGFYDVKEYSVENEDGEKVPIATIHILDDFFRYEKGMDSFDFKIVEPLALKYSSYYKIMNREEIYDYYKRRIKEKKGTLLLNDSDILIIYMYKYFKNYLNFDISILYELVIDNICKKLEPIYHDNYYLDLDHFYESIQKPEYHRVFNQLEGIANILTKEYDLVEVSKALDDISYLISSLAYKIKKEMKNKIETSSVYKTNLVISKEEFRRVLEEELLDLIDYENVSIPFNTIIKLLPIDVVKKAINRAVNNYSINQNEMNAIYEVSSELCKTKEGKRFDYNDSIRGVLDYYRNYLSEEMEQFDQGVDKLKESFVIK